MERSTHSVHISKTIKVNVTANGKHITPLPSKAVVIDTGLQTAIILPFVDGDIAPTGLVSVLPLVR